MTDHRRELLNVAAMARSCIGFGRNIPRPISLELTKLWSMKHDQKGARYAYTAAIDMPDAPTDLRAMALYNRALLYAAAKEIPKAIQALNAVPQMTNPLPKVKLAARRTLDRLQRRDCMDIAPRLPARASSSQVAPPA